ncbi:Peptidoglycan-binding (PGRP) domain of peptidoglycan hydrolases-containing protein [Micromonospora pattaloongensis]|uniref:Peptidoglycan-binding (PGRP) domain of peptidoglycan hydrolases-containing protein n=1 Tax=Micromonospora pattaloongensis TaxID=405436 RepID=A0A1H3JEU7_9ACTN|nr:peptidoglycan-binding protein [Micromonospora pattaloongensis]SDY38456.1 Peptidoglycan-binding (PGRP) domain of peptidoglycan hydrolases-containing protein [Micromonospora pattaloongensis]
MSFDHHELDRRTLFKAGLGAAAVAVVGSQLGAAGAAHAAPAAGLRAAPVADLDWIIDCDGWGARPPSGALQVSNTMTNKIIVHHMAFPNTTDYSREQAVKLARDCQDLHMDGNRWSDTGQHFTVSRGGYVLEGRRGSLATLRAGERQMIAAHCPGENGRAIGIESEGTYITQTPPAALLDSLTRLCVEICRQYGLHAHDIFGHWDFRATQCPGVMFYREFPALRRRVAAGLGADPADIPERRWPDIWRFVGGPVVRVAQYLLNFRGYPMPIDGVFGSATVAAVQDWQARNGLPVDVDATLTGPTWESLAPELDKDATGLPVSAAQYILNLKGYAEVAVTGAYDHPTKKAVQDLQRLHGLPPHGELDMSTWCAVTGGVVREAFRRR